MNKFLALALSTVSMIGIANAAPQFYLEGGISPSMKVGTAGDTLGTMLTTQGTNTTAIATAQAAATAAQTTANAAIPKSGNMDSSGNITAPINTSLVRVGAGSGYGTYYVNPSPSGGADGVTHVDFSSFLNELTIWDTAAGSNLLTLWNKSPTGFTALAFRGYDQDLGTQFEHLAIGYFPGLNIGGLKGYSGQEQSSYDMNNDAGERASLFVDQETGAHFDGTGVDFTGIIPTGDLTHIKCPNGCTFPSGVAAYSLVESQSVYGLFPKKAVIIAGAGTSELTMSAAANYPSADQVNGQALVSGSSSYDQTDWQLRVPMGNVDYFRFVDLHDNTFYNSPTPFFSVDRRRGRLGVYNPNPQSEVDTVGHTTSGFGGQGILPANVLVRQNCEFGAFNACVIGGTGDYRQDAYSLYDASTGNGWQSISTGTLYRTTANGVIAQDLNMTNGDVQTYHHPVNAQSAAYSLLISDCGTTISVTGTTAITNGWGLPAGCRITISNMGTGTVTIVPGQDLTLGWYDTKPETGTYTLPGQYSSVVLEAKTSYVTTVERGQ